LYQTALICLQSFGSSTDVLKALGPLLETGFIGAAALSVSSPQRLSKTATIRRTPFAQPTTLDPNFVMGTTSPSITFPSRLPRSPLRSPKKTFRQGEHAAKACGSAPSTPKLNKRRASNLPTDSPPKKSHSGRVARKSNDDDGDGNCGDRDAGIEDNGEVQREEVLKSLLLPVTPSSAAQRHSHLRPVCPT